MDHGTHPEGYYSRPMPSASPSFYPTPTPNRTGTPNTDGGRTNPFGEDNSNVPSPRPHQGTDTNPFTSPDASRPVSSQGSSSALDRRNDGPRYFQSRKVRKGDIEKPWLEKSDPKEKWVTIIPIIGIFIGLAISGFLIYDGYSSVVQHKYCPVLDDDFSSGLNPNTWSHEIQLGGFGNREFAQTTDSAENVYVENGNLVIKATLQNEKYINKDHVINLLKDGSCTSKVWSDCVAATNTTTGNSSIVPPTLSGRINTKKSATIKYGRVEVTAKLPAGDWLWPAIWMMPVNNTYGPWPSSGEIDIVESRGNNWTYAQGGNNIMSSALHWGPDPAHDAFWKTNNKRKILRGAYSDDFHTFGLEWSEKYIFTYINTRLLQVMYVNWKKPAWQQGNFPDVNANGTRVGDIWAQTGNPQTPFDQPFYLIINLAVGGQNGWFEDGKSGKPWVDNGDNAKKDFWEARDKWYPTWTQPQLEVKRVVMQQQCDGGEL